MDANDRDVLQALKLRLRKFAETTDWGQIHSPKKLSIALIGEMAELVEHFQWLTEEQSAKLPHDKVSEVAQQLADILICLIRLADKLDVDLVQAAEKKIDLNEKKYPADKVRGSSKKYTEY